MLIVGVIDLTVTREEVVALHSSMAVTLYYLK